MRKKTNKLTSKQTHKINYKKTTQQQGRSTKQKLNEKEHRIKEP